MDRPPPPPPPPPRFPTIPPAWYTDPSDPTSYRYWDGRTWTEHTAPRFAAASEPRRLPAWLVPTHVSGWAVASGYLGLVSFIFFGVPGPFAVATGVLGLRQIRRQPELNGTVRAWVGIVMGTLATMLIGGIVAVYAVANSLAGLALGALATLSLVALIVVVSLRRS